MLQAVQALKERPLTRSKPAGSFLRVHWLVLVPVLLVVAGCGGGSSSSSSSSNGTLTISPGTIIKGIEIDTNCTGCNGSSGGAIEGFTATLSGRPANVIWSVSGGDPSEGAGTIDPQSGRYTPPPFLTADSVKVTVTATLVSDPSVTASTTITVTPGFLQPLSPENVALGANGTATITGYIAEAGGTTGVNFALSSSPDGSSGGQGTLVSAPCARSRDAFTSCTVTYTAPSSISSTGATYIVATVGTSFSTTSTEVLLNTADVNSNPLTHESEQTGAISLGTSGGNDLDYDTTVQNGQTRITDCCGGTLGALIQNSGGTQYILSNNHVLARSDQASTGADITQPGLVDDNCDPTKGTLVGQLTAWLPLNSSATNADAAIAKVNPGAVDASGAILELGAKQTDGSLAAAPPGTSSTGGKGQAPSINMTVAKSGRTTGLTCANIAALNLSVQVQYFKDCGETQPYLTKTYSNQIGIEGNNFSDAGDSGSLVVNTSNAEPVGLFFAGGTTNTGVSEGVASPVSTVLSELDTKEGTTYTFVGTTDHQVSCLDYGSSTVSAAQARTLTGPQIQRAQTALAPARQLVNPTTGILGVATGKSSDQPGTPAILVYVSRGSTAKVPATIDGLRTVVIHTTANAVATGSAPQTAFFGARAPALQASVLSQAVTVKQRIVGNLMKQHPAFFGVGVGQSYDDPSQAALVIYVDRNNVPATLPATIGGLRTRYIIMNRLHVTRAYLSPVPTHSRCMIHAEQPASFKPFKLSGPNPFKLY